MFNKYTKIIFAILIVIIIASVILISKNKKDNDAKIEQNQNIVLSDKSCGFTLVSPKENDGVYKNFTVEAIVDNTKREERGCGWTVFEGQAGFVHIYDTRGLSVGSALLTATGEWMTMGPANFEADINIDIEPADKNLMMVIEEDDPAGFGDSEVLSIPLTYKK